MARIVSPDDNWYDHVVGDDELAQTSGRRSQGRPGGHGTDPGDDFPDTGPGPDAFDLERLISPLDVDTFQRDFWERKPLIIERDDPKYYTDLLTIDDVDRLLTLAGPKFDNLVLIDNHKSSRVSTAERSENEVLKDIYDRYRRGATIVMNSLHSRWGPLQRLNEALGADIGAIANVNVYITPGGSQGLDLHHDGHDVFVAQVHGSKEWCLYGMRHRLPFDDGKYREKSAGSSKIRQRFSLATGDLLYLPRGIIHTAASLERASIHCTIGVKPLLWGMVLQEAIRDIFEEDVRFRRSLPLGIARDPAAQGLLADHAQRLAEDIVRRFSADSVAAGAIRRVAAMNPPSPRGGLAAMEGRSGD